MKVLQNNTQQFKVFTFYIKELDRTTINRLRSIMNSYRTIYPFQKFQFGTILKKSKSNHCSPLRVILQLQEKLSFAICKTQYSLIVLLKGVIETFSKYILTNFT